MTTENAVAKPPKYYTEPSKVDVGGLSVAYRRKGSGEPILFLHGAGLTRMWMPFYEELSKHYDLIVPEHPGFGETPFVEYIRSFDDLVLHYDDFLQALGIDECHVVGFSLGGWLAAEFAAYYPRQLKSLTLINPMGIRIDWPVEDDMFAIGPEEIGARLFNNPDIVGDYLFPGEPSLEETIHSYGEASMAARLMWTPRYNLKLERRMARVTCPANVLIGEDDRLIPDAIGRRFAESLPNCSINSVKGTGHAIFADQPVASADAINEFIKGIAK